MVSLSLPHFHFDIISNFSAFCDSTFMITLQTSFYISNIVLSKQNTELDPFLVFNLLPQDTGLKTNSTYTQGLYKNKYAASIGKAQSLDMSVDRHWGQNVRAFKAYVEFLDNGTSFTIAQGNRIQRYDAKDPTGEFKIEEFFFETSDFVSLNSLMITNQSAGEDFIVSSVKLVGYEPKNEEADLSSIEFVENTNSAFIKANIAGQEVYKVSGTYIEDNIRYYALSFGQIGEIEGKKYDLLYLTVEYLDNGNNTTFFEISYKDEQGNKKKAGKVYIGDSGEWKRQTFILLNAFVDNTAFSIYTNHQNFYFTNYEITEKSPFKSEQYFDFATDFGFYQNSMRTTQGYRGWTYNTFRDNQYEALSLLSGQWKTSRDSYPYLILKTSGPTFHPVRYEDLTIGWRAEKDADITIYSTPKMETVNAGNGVNAKILHGSRMIANRDISPTDNYGTTDIVTLNVKAGEQIYFRLNCIESQLSYDVTQWDIKIVVNENKVNLKSVTTTSVFLNVGTVSNGNGMLLLPSDELHFYSTKENGTLLMKHSPIDGVQRVAFKLDDCFANSVSGLNPTYFSVMLYDVAGIGLKLQYTNLRGELCETEYADTYGTNTWKKAFFMISNIDLNKEITIIGECGNGISLMRIEASTVPMQDYEVVATPSNYEGLYPAGVKASESYFEVEKELSFNIHDSYLYRQSSTSVYLEVEYFDNGSSFQVEYDAVGNDKALTKIHTAKANKQIRTAYFKLGNGFFGNSKESNTDFKIINKGNEKLLVSKVKVSKSLSPSYAAQIGYGLEVDAETNTVDKRNVKTVEKGKTAKAYLDDDFIYNVVNAGLYYAMVTFKDNENIQFKLEYDGYPLPAGYDQSIPTSYRPSWTVHGTGSGQWKTTLLSLPYAKFANSQDGKSDFQIVNLGNDLIIEDIKIISGATLGMRDLATLDCILEVSSIGEDGTEENKNLKAFGPDYNKIGLGGILDGTSSEGPDYITVRFPYMQKTKVSGMKVNSFADFRMEYWDEERAEWIKIIDITDAYNVPHDDRIIMFDPVETSAIRYSGYDYRGNFYLKKVEVYGEAEQDRTVHKGNLGIVNNGPFELDQDAAFEISTSNFDVLEDEYEVRVHWKNYYKESVVDNFYTTTVKSDESKIFDVVIPHSHAEYQSGPYYLTVEIWKDNRLLDSRNELWGVKGIAPRKTSSEPQPRYMKERSLGTMGQFHFGLGSPIEPEAIRQLKKFGFNSIQIECYWGDLEPIIGVYNFELYDRALEVAREEGLTVDLSIHMLDRRVPNWIPDEEIMRDQFGGYVVPRSMQIYAYNSLVYTPSYWGEVSMPRLYKAIELLAERYKDDPIVSGYAVATVACEVSYSSDSYRFFDYSEPAQKAYKEEYLQKVLGLDLDGVNKRWRTDYENWDEIRMFAPAYDLYNVETNPEWPDTLDFLHYTITHYQNQVSQAIRKHDRSRDLQFFLNEHYEYDQELINGKLKYNDSGVGDLAVENGDSFPQYAFFGRIVGVRVHSEPGNIPAKNTLDGNAGRALFLSASGGRSTITWQASKQPRAIGKSLTTDTVAADKGLEIIKKNQRLTEEVLGAQYTPNEAAAISQLKSWSTEKALRSVGRSTDAYSNGLTKNQLETALLEHEFDDNLHRGVDWFNPEFAPEIYMSPDKLKQYKIIFDCGNKVLDLTAQKNLIEYVKQGGKLVLMGDSGNYDDRRDNEWYLLKELSSGRAIPPSEIDTTAVPVVFGTSSVFSTERSIRLRNTRDISDWTWAETLGTSSGKPLVKRWDFGKGSVVYAAGVPDILVTPQFRGWISGLYDWAGVKSKVETKYTSISGHSEGVYTGVKEVGSDRYVLMWSNNPNGDTAVNVKLTYLAPSKTYNVYLMEEDHDVFLQTISGSQFLKNELVFGKNELKVLKYTEATNYNLERDFSKNQTDSRFTYGYDKGGGFVQAITFDNEKQIHISEDKNSAIGQGYFVPSQESKAILKWTAPFDGIVRIEGKISPQSEAKDIKVSILKEKEVIWSNKIDSKYYSSKAVAQVNKCDKLYFVVEGDGNLENGKVFWNLDLDLSLKGELFQVSPASGRNERTWVAPQDGKAIIFGDISMEGNTNETSIVAILRNDLGIWRQTMYGGTSSQHFVEIDVKKNQVIQFIIEENLNNQNINWSPNVMLIK